MLRLPAQNAAEYQMLADRLGLGEVFEVARIKKHNNIDRLTRSAGMFYCKTYTNSLRCF